MNLVLLDRKSIGDDIDIKVFERFGKLISYDYTEEIQINKRIKEADIIITNKAKINSETLKNSRAKLICVTATGVDNIDLNYCKSENIAVCNVRGYSTESVVQHTFALLFSLWERIFDFYRHVNKGKYIEDKTYSHYEFTFSEMKDKNFGIIGLGAIGNRVAQVAKTIGFNVFYWSSSDVDRSNEYKRLNFDELIKTCDVISIHSPLTNKTKNLFGKEEFLKMKKKAVIINVARGGIINEEALVEAMQNNVIGAAGIDVLSTEPMTKSSKYINILGRSNFIITPHVAWAAVESRTRCLDEICINIDSWLEGGTRNRV